MGIGAHTEWSKGSEGARVARDEWTGAGVGPLSVAREPQSQTSAPTRLLTLAVSMAAISRAWYCSKSSTRFM